MSKMQEIITALKEIGRPAYAAEIAEMVGGVDPHIVSCALNQYVRRGQGNVGRRLIGARPGGRKVALFFVCSWEERLKRMDVSYPDLGKNSFFASPFRPIEDPREFGWHRRGIARYGFVHWAWITNRDPMDLLQKLSMKNCEEAKHEPE